METRGGRAPRGQSPDNGPDSARHAPAAPPLESFLRLVERELMMCRRYGVGMAVLLIRLDGLDAVTQHHGEETRSRLLDAVAQRLKGRLRAHDAVGRVKHDAFGVALFNVGEAAVKWIEARLFDELSTPYRVGEQTVEVMAVTGAAAFPRAGVTAEELVQGAQLALAARAG